ncbi:MAG TPA: hypothetical protein VFO94_14065, partial [Gammaproteobacteria bacterium]|nr:hypothetical protein [Gammaproteobacteria bacterium]
LALIQPFSTVLPTLYGYIGWITTGLAYFFVYLSVVLCIASGLPVIAEFIYAQRNDILRGSGNKA